MLTTSMREDFGKQELIDEQYRILSEDTDFIFNNSTYTILSQEKLIGKGGETTIYKAKDNHDMIFAAKIYRKSIEDLSDYEKLNEIRLRLSSGYAQNHMLPLLAYDKQWVYKQSNGELVTTQIEIMPYIETDNIAQCSYKLLRESIIPGIVNAINTLHREGFIHRDIKPMNIYIYNGVAVLGDFGTAGVPRRKNNFAEYMPTKRLRGTPGYMAPEAAMGTPSKESDYFALGCTIATLYRGFHPYIIESESNEKYELSTEFLSQVGKGGMPLNCSDSEQDLQILVDALCQSQKENRAGYDDVMLWLQDTDAFITKMRNKNRIIKKNEGTGFEFSFLDKTYHSKLELVEAYVAEWDEAKAQFFRGVTPETNRLITYLIRERNDKCTDKIGKILDDRKNDTQNQMNLDLAFAQVLHFLCEGEKENKFYWCGQSFGSSANSISEALYDRREEQKNHEQITQMLMSGYLSWKLSQNKTQDLEVLNAINHVHNIENMCITTPKLAYYTLMYAYLDETKYVHEKPDDLFVRISRSTSVFYEEVKQIINEQKYFASLIHQGYDSNELASEVAKMNGDFKDDLLRFYLIMESVCDNKNKAVVRQHYYQYGPLSYAYWIKENLDLYTFTSDTAETNAKRIKDVTISPSLELGKIHENMVALKAYCANLYREFQNNILLTQFGIMDGKSVYALHSDAFFYEVFLDETVPVGFKNYISQ